MTQNKGKARILVVPLDWGLGHATRCIPIIKLLLENNVDVYLAGEGAQKTLLKKEFPLLPFLDVEGYRIRYAKSKFGLISSLLLQIPAILRAIKAEKKWLHEMIAEHQLDAVISDNRYGMYSDTIPSVFITHQLKIKTPFGNWADKILQKKNYRLINRFTECWVPDFKTDNSLAGELSHPKQMPSIPVYYIGILSRFLKSDRQYVENHVLVLLSGPEPQRTILEEKIIKDISHYRYTATIVRGLPAAKQLIPSGTMIRFFNHLPTDELANEIEKASFVICRSGYSSVMDLFTLGKKSILIPTPGQTEQEYLASKLYHDKSAVFISQKEFSLQEALTKAKQFDYHLPVQTERGLLEIVFNQFLKKIH